MSSLEDGAYLGKSGRNRDDDYNGSHPDQSGHTRDDDYVHLMGGAHKTKNRTKCGSQPDQSGRNAEDDYNDTLRRVALNTPPPGATTQALEKKHQAVWHKIEQAELIGTKFGNLAVNRKTGMQFLESVEMRRNMIARNFSHRLIMRTILIEWGKALYILPPDLVSSDTEDDDWEGSDESEDEFGPSIDASAWSRGGGSQVHAQCIQHEEEEEEAKALQACPKIGFTWQQFRTDANTDLFHVVRECATSRKRRSQRVL